MGWVLVNFHSHLLNADWRLPGGLALCPLSAVMIVMAQFVGHGSTQWWLWI
jgi:hypothetical protein